MDKVKFFRSRDNKNIAGVCAGVAKYYGLDADTVRYWYVFAHFFGVPMFSVYLIQWLIYPQEES